VQSHQQQQQQQQQAVPPQPFSQAQAQPPPRESALPDSRPFSPPTLAQIPSQPAQMAAAAQERKLKKGTLCCLSP
jgi:hypothetical protein